MANKDNISSSTIYVENVNLITKKFTKDLHVRVRSTGKLLSAKIEINKNNGAKIISQLLKQLYHQVRPVFFIVKMK